jgi:hypothetical protein
VAALYLGIDDGADVGVLRAGGALMDLWILIIGAGSALAVVVVTVLLSLLLALLFDPVIRIDEDR